MTVHSEFANVIINRDLRLMNFKLTGFSALIILLNSIPETKYAAQNILFQTKHEEDYIQLQTLPHDILGE